MRLWTLARAGLVALTVAAATAAVPAAVVPAAVVPAQAQLLLAEPAPGIWSATTPAGSWSGSGGTAAQFVFGPGTGNGNGSAGRWLFNDGAGTTSRDSSGNGRTATLGGDAVWVAGRGGYVLKTSGAGFAATATSVVPTNASFTVTAWAKPSSVPLYSTVVSQDGGGGFPAFDMGTRDGYWHFDRRPSRDVYTYPVGINGPAVQTGVWTHLMGVYDHANSRLILYVNWTYVGEIAFSNANGWLATGGLNIGRSGGWGADPFYGEIDDVRVWSGAISVATAQATSTAATFRYALDGGAPTTVSAAGVGGDTTVSITPGADGPHTLTVTSLDSAGASSDAGSYQFNSGPGGITQPKTGARVGNETLLSGVAHPGTTGVTYQWRRTDADTWANIPLSDVVRASNGGAITWPLASTGSGVFPDLKWKVENTIGAAESPFQLRGLWTGGIGGASYANRPLHQYGLVSPIAGCSGGLASGGDFNGDGVRDTVIADPMVTLDGVWAAGAVHVVDGATGAYRTLDERLPEVPGEIVSGDRFGWSTAVYDANGDRCADLVVGVPKKDVGSLVDAGVVYVFFGTPAGVGRGPVVTWEQGVNGIPGTSVSYDNFGYAVSAGQYQNEPFLIIGAPGDDHTGSSDAGRITYLRGAYKLSFNATEAGGIGAGSESDDRGGEAIASTPTHFAVAFPGEDINGGANEGRVCVFRHTIVSSAYNTPIGCVDQAANARVGDSLGKSIAMAPYRKPGTSSTTDSILVVGVPGENGGTGLVQQFHVTDTSVTEIPNSSTGGSAVGQLYGEKVFVVNTAGTGVESNDQNLILAVGVPGRVSGSVVNTGEVRVLPAAKNSTLAYDVRVNRRAGSLPGTAVAHELVGMHLGGTPSMLLVPSPYQGQQAVYGIEWAKLITNASDVKTVWVPPPAGGAVAANRAGDWALNENTGTLADDSAGPADLTLSGATWTAGGHSGAGLSFAGGTALAQTTGPVLNTSQSFTVEVWVKLTTAAEWENAVSQWATNHMGFTLAYSQADNAWAMTMINQDGQPAVTSALSTSVPQSGVWTRLTGVYDASAGQLRIYVNGVLERSVAYTSNWSAGGPLTVGNGRWWGQPTDPWRGDLDEIRVWQRALTTAEIAQTPGGAAAEAFGAQVG